MILGCKAAGVNPQGQAHYLDHLAPVCILMGAPLLFTDEALQALAESSYPGLQTLYVEPEEFSREFLIAQYDLLLMSDLWDKKTFHEKYALLEKKYQKRLRHVHCPHGFSDKGYYLRKCAEEDILLVYGQNMIDLLESEHVQVPLHVRSGNYRYSYYKKHRPFYEALYQEQVQARFLKKQRTLLYAPTWKDQEEATSFFAAAEPLFEALPGSWNMIVKLHPQLEQQEIADYYRIVGRYERKPNLLFLKEFPPVFPVLAQVDAYIGDMSSVGYDFLPFNKPMFFLNQQKLPQTDRRCYLYRCGVEVRPEAYPHLYTLIESNLEDDADRFSSIRAEMYAYTFGEERSFEQIKNEILAAADL
jgi:hypothetical protein